MGGGDLNMKKSWHPLLRKNQERVWLEEKKALEEKKKLDQLRKEKEEERQLQELQRLQEEQTGRKKSEKLDWMYSTPATGTSTNANDLEDYLLGKKRVDKILVGNENEKVGAAHKDFIAVQNANTARDIAAKIREDPLLAIKQQEQAAYQALMSNPLRLKEMQERNGIKVKKDKKDKKDEKEKERKDKHSKDNHRHSHREERRHQSRSTSPDDFRPVRRESDSPPRGARRERSKSHSFDSRGRGRSMSLDGHHHHEYRRSRRGRDDRSWDESRRFEESRRSRHHEIRSSRPHLSDETSSEERRSRESDGSHGRGRRGGYDRDNYSKRKRSTTPPYNNKRVRTSPPRHPPPSRPPNGYSDAAEERAARLAAMTSNASSLTVDRKERLTALLEQEKAEAEAEERARAKSKGMGNFLNNEQKKAFGGGTLEDRIKRGRGGMVVEAE
ncbi:hypothetical protein BD410DRAFT_739408 [Rickenella mellea]|uniref:CBF1-interacting co-repressor CIR N-terminal domain-containing protein n=1 Tax=Rickenella mellea TaxID=50990 RepID=A0A4Y7QLA3_9AGAM|nr:hypothetical protein BD410DRAFT_739408 [Rickenella mellea]